MNQQDHPLSRLGLDEAFAAQDAVKSKLILEARLLREQRQNEDAACRFAQAAAIEERLSQQCLSRGLVEKARVHQFSAASCWGQAGNFYQAIALCDELLAQADLPSRLRVRVHDYAQTLRSRRAQWYSTLTLEAVDIEG